VQLGSRFVEEDMDKYEQAVKEILNPKDGDK
jgi:hypothetical protein